MAVIKCRIFSNNSCISLRWSSYDNVPVCSHDARYKYGRNINVSNKNAIDARDLDLYRLPKIGHQTNYLFAKEDFFFLYPNEQNKYKERLNNSFQHGGVSMEEMLIPIFTMTPK